MENFYKRVLMAQNELKAPKNQFNKFGGYKYRSCEDILEAAKPICLKYGLLLTVCDEVVNIGDRYYIKADATLNDTESDSALINTAYARESSEKKGMDDSQVTGTASSYARKYALNGLFCIDDTKDADSDEYHTQTEQRADFICEECGRKIEAVKTAKKTYTPADLAMNSKKVYQKCLCYTCLMKRKNEVPNE